MYKNLHQEVWGNINRIDLNPIKNRFIVKKKWTQDRTEKAIENYRRFLYFCVLFPGTGMEPTKEVDEVWHDHILHMKKYERDCLEFCGRMIIHEPYPTKLEDVNLRIVLSEAGIGCEKTSDDPIPVCNVKHYCEARQPKVTSSDCDEIGCKPVAACQDKDCCAKPGGHHETTVVMEKISFTKICEETFGEIPT